MLKRIDIFSKLPIYIGLCALLFVLSACQPVQRMRETQANRTAAQTPTVETAAHTEHASAAVLVSRAELTEPVPIELDPARGQEIGAVYEAFLSPHQEGGEEEETPKLVPQQFLATFPKIEMEHGGGHIRGRCPLLHGNRIGEGRVDG